MLPIKLAFMLYFAISKIAVLIFMFTSTQAREVEAFFDVYRVVKLATNRFKNPNKTVLLCVSVSIRGKGVEIHFTVAPCAPR